MTEHRYITRNVIKKQLVNEPIYGVDPKGVIIIQLCLHSETNLSLLSYDIILTEFLIVLTFVYIIKLLLLLLDQVQLPQGSPLIQHVQTVHACMHAWPAKGGKDTHT